MTTLNNKELEERYHQVLFIAEKYAYPDEEIGDLAHEIWLIGRVQKVDKGMVWRSAIWSLLAYRKKRDWPSKQIVVKCQSLDAMKESGYDVAVMDKYLQQADDKDFCEFAINSLNNVDRQLVKWLYYEGKTCVQIAKGLGISKQAVYLRRDVVLEKLRNQPTQRQ